MIIFVEVRGIFDLPQILYALNAILYEIMGVKINFHYRNLSSRGETRRHPLFRVDRLGDSICISLGMANGLPGTTPWQHKTSLSELTCVSRQVDVRRPSASVQLSFLQIGMWHILHQKLVLQYSV